MLSARFRRIFLLCRSINRIGSFSGFTLSWLAETLVWRKWLIILVAYKERGVFKTFTVFHNSTQQLFLYYKISFRLCDRYFSQKELSIYTLLSIYHLKCPFLYLQKMNLFCLWKLDSLLFFSKNLLGNKGIKQTMFIRVSQIAGVFQILIFESCTLYHIMPFGKIIGPVEKKVTKSWF